MIELLALEMIQMEEGDHLLRETQAMNQQMEELQTEITHYKSMQENYNRIRNQVSEFIDLLM